MIQPDSRSLHQWQDMLNLRPPVVLLFCIPLCILLQATASLAQQQVVTTGPQKGALILVGGGASRPAYMERFMELAGGEGANIVVIPTSLPDKVLTPDGLKRLHARVQELFGPATTLLHTRDRKTADSPAFIEPLRHATGVWILGGSERDLAGAYVGTRTEAEIKALVARGGVVGGTSAGAMILGSVLMDARLASSTGGKTDPRVNILGTRPAFDLLTSSVVVPHWGQRKINFNLLQAAFDYDPGRLGIGIDEDTAVIVQGNRLEVLGDCDVGIYDGKNHNGRPFLLLASGESYNLKDRVVQTPVQLPAQRSPQVACPVHGAKQAGS